MPLALPDLPSGRDLILSASNSRIVVFTIQPRHAEMGMRHFCCAVAGLSLHIARRRTNGGRSLRIIRPSTIRQRLWVRGEQIAIRPSAIIFKEKKSKAIWPEEARVGDCDLISVRFAPSTELAPANVLAGLRQSMRSSRRRESTRNSSRLSAYGRNRFRRKRVR